MRTVDAEQIDAGVERVAVLSVATERWQLDELSESVDVHHRHGDRAELMRK